jgi:hypothetical protein
MKRKRLIFAALLSTAVIGILIVLHCYEVRIAALGVWAGLTLVVLLCLTLLYVAAISIVHSVRTLRVVKPPRPKAVEYVATWPDRAIRIVPADPVAEEGQSTSTLRDVATNTEQFLKQIFVIFGWLFLAFAILFVTIKTLSEAWQQAIVVESIFVPEELQKVGVNEQYIVEQLIQRVRSAQSQTRFANSPGAIGTATLPEVPPIEIPGAGISLQSIQHYVVGVIRRNISKPTRIRGSIVKDRDTLILSVQIISPREDVKRPPMPKSQKFVARNVSIQQGVSVVSDLAADYLIRYFDPYLATLNSFTAKDRDPQQGLYLAHFCREFDSANSAGAYNIAGLIHLHRLSEHSSAINQFRAGIRTETGDSSIKTALRSNWADALVREIESRSKISRDSLYLKILKLARGRGTAAERHTIRSLIKSYQVWRDSTRIGDSILNLCAQSHSLYKGPNYADFVQGYYYSIKVTEAEDLRYFAALGNANGYEMIINDLLVRRFAYGAIASYDRARDLKVNRVQALNNMADARVSLGDIAGGAELYNAAKFANIDYGSEQVVNKGYQFLVGLGLAQAYANKWCKSNDARDIKQALKIMADLADKFPNMLESDNYWYRLAYIYFAANRPDSSVAIARRIWKTKKGRLDKLVGTGFVNWRYDYLLDCALARKGKSFPKIKQHAVTYMRRLSAR